jgi:acyl-CoA dehydrogenase
VQEQLARSLDGLLKGEETTDAREGLWHELMEHGLAHPFLNGAEEWQQGAVVIRGAGRHATGLHLAENVAGSFVLARSGVAFEARRMTLCDPLQSDLRIVDGKVSGKAGRVPHASVSSHVLAECRSETGETVVALVELRGVVAECGESAAGEPRDDLALRDCPAEVCLRVEEGASPLLWLGAAMRAGQMLGLAETVLTMTLEHVQTRKQFGRPLSSMQAVQQSLAVLAGEVAAAQMAAGLADRSIDQHGLQGLQGLEKLHLAAPEIAAAKAQADTLAGVAIEVGHQLHGAMGFTREYALHRFTRRLMSYRAEFGHGRYHARWLGERAARMGEQALWPDSPDS